MRENNRYSKFDKLVFYGSIIDVFFLPYAFFVAVAYSFFLLLPWLAIHFSELKKKKEFRLYIACSILVLLSTVYGSYLHRSDLGNNVARAIQIIQIIGYYFMFTDYLEKNTVNLKPFFVGFVVFVFLFAVLYNVNSRLYSNLVPRWNPRGFSGMVALYGGLTGRFGFLWMDANNIAYTFVALVGFLLTNERTKTYEKFLLILSLMLVLFSSMSSGGFISLAVLVALLAVVLPLNTFIKKKGKVKRSTVIAVLFSPVLIALFVAVLWRYLQSNVAVAAIERLSSNTLDSRLDIWRQIIDGVSFWRYILLGQGGTTYVGGSVVKPHNGHFYMILAFGMLAYILFMYIVFRKRRITPWKNYVWISAIFLGFSGNILLGEVKLFAIVMLLVSCTGSRRYLYERGHICE